MPQSTCPTCGIEVYVSEKNHDHGTEVYCSEACAAIPPATAQTKSNIFAAHSPLPWYMIPAYPVNHPIIVQSQDSHDDEEGRIIAEFLPGAAPGQDEANARLFLAAPDMLAALKMWDQGFAEGEHVTLEQLLAWLNTNRRAARAAIAKAESGAM